MAESKELVHETGEISHISTQINGHPRDLLKRFKAATRHHHHHKKTELVAASGEDNEEIELNLGLSLGGCFGVNPRENNRLVRSSSIAGLTTLPPRDEDDAAALPPAVCPALTRTSSLPMETEEEWRKRKELQSFRRMEAKRKRSEKQKQFRAGKDRTSNLEGNCEDDQGLKGNIKVDGSPSINVGGTAAATKQQQQHVGANGLKSSSSVAVAPPFGLSSWAAALVRGMDASSTNGKVKNVVAAAAASRGCQTAVPSSQGSLGSQGSSSSGISEFESRPVQGMSNCNEVRSPSSVQSLPEQQLSEQKPIIAPRSISEKPGGAPTAARGEMENHQSNKKPKVVENGGREMGMKVMEEMPCVSTKGDGPNGKIIEGFLYKYRKGEEVRIVCVCHGNFLTPAEFVKHAGGGDVAHPLRHIVVNPSPSFLS